MTKALMLIIIDQDEPGTMRRERAERDLFLEELPRSIEEPSRAHRPRIRHLDDPDGIAILEPRCRLGVGPERHEAVDIRDPAREIDLAGAIAVQRVMTDRPGVTVVGDLGGVVILERGNAPAEGGKGDQGQSCAMHHAGAMVQWSNHRHVI